MKNGEKEEKEEKEERTFELESTANASAKKTIRRM